jgi:S-DNA-T family DNA segregation ATPase FtsK/SpoIIIE
VLLSLRGLASRGTSGVTLVLLAVLAVLGDLGLAGPAGRVLRSGTALAFGWGQVVVPLALGWLGAVLMAREPSRAPGSGRRTAVRAAQRPDASLEGRVRDARAGRIGLGLAAGLVALSGLMALAAGAATVHAAPRVLERAGGLVGAGAAEGLTTAFVGTGAASGRRGRELATFLAAGAAGAARLVARAWSLLGEDPSALGPDAEEAPGQPGDHPLPPSSHGPWPPPGTEPGGAWPAGHHAAGAQAEGGAAEGGGDEEAAGAPRAPAGFGDGAGAEPSSARSGPAAAAIPGAEGACDPGLAPTPGRRATTPAAGAPVGSLGRGPGGTDRPAWRLPPPTLLATGKARPLDRDELARGGAVLERALAAHGVATRLVGMTVGPTVTRYELELGPGVKVARVTSLAKDIAYAMASPDVRILAPIPGRSAIGVEVPNRKRQLVTLGDVLACEEVRRATHPLEVPLGRDIAGRPVVVNLADMPHLLIAGATGSGKSSCINSIVTSILMRSTPDEVRLILVDPKRVELGQYNGLPHLLAQVVVNPKRAANALAWAVAEMERRYDLLAEAGVRDIASYNAMAAGSAPWGRRPQGPSEVESATSGFGRVPRPAPLPFVLVVVDELNDLMMVAARDVEDSVCRIAQMARAVGIHLVIATQRPSVDVITGVIKANIPSRLAFSVSSLADSRVILDQAGAERLVGKGDMLLLTASSSVPRRVQGPFVSEAEVRAVVDHWRRQGPGAPNDAPSGLEGFDAEDEEGGSALEEDDELFAKAMELVVRSQLGSTSMLQRKLRIGFSRAGRLMDLLERRGVVGPSEGSKARAVLMTPEELDALQSR